MEPRHLCYFVAVAQVLNFIRATEELHTSQPSLNSQIRDLEDCVSIPLLVRGKRKIALTAAGKCFLQGALAVLEQTKNAKLWARKIVQEDRQLTVGFVPSAEVNLLPKALPMFCLRQPDTLVELVSLIVMQQEEKIHRSELDVGLMCHPVYSPGIDYLEFFDELLVVVLSADHPLAHEREITAVQLDGVNFVSTDSVYSGSLTPIARAWFVQENSRPNIAQVAMNTLATMNLVGMGLGVTLIPGYMNNSSTGQVVLHPIAGNVLSIALLVAWKKEEMKSTLRDFITIVQEHLAGITAQLRIIFATRAADLSFSVFVNWRYRHRGVGLNIPIFQPVPTFD